MPAQGDFWVLVFIGLLIANLVFRFYVRLDLDKKINELLREVKSVKENLVIQEVNGIKANKNAGELVQQIKDVKENLIHIQQNFGNKLMDLLQEVNDIKGRLILDLDKKVSKLSQEVEGIQVKDIKENLIHIQQNFDKKLAELLQEVNDIKVRLILELDKKTDKLSQEVENIRGGIEQLEQQTKERMERIAKLLTEPIFDEDQLKI
jgi:hypothetical protein